MSFWALLAQDTYVYRPFVNAMPIWHYWPVLLLPLCAAIAIVYKSIRCSSMRAVPKEATMLFVFILLVMALTAAGLGGLVAVLR
jgi:hypothetical protein